MARRSPGEIYQAARAAGFGMASAITMTAIALAESGGDDAAVGDVGLQDSKWGPSVGLWQVRTLKSDTGRGTDRDIVALQGSVGRQAQAAYAISNRGTNYSPWAVWTSGAYRQFLGQAQAAGGASAQQLPPAGMQLLGLGDAGDTVDRSVRAARKLGLEAVAAVFGLALVGAALWLGVHRADPAGKVRGKFAQAFGGGS